MALLEVRGLRAAYGQTRVLHGIDFALQESSITALLGANGAGKTTTLRALCAMVRTEGEVRFSGARIDGRATEDIVGLRIAHVPEGRGTFVDLTVEENLRVGMYARRDRGEAVRDLDRVLGYFPILRERRRQVAGTLSGGEQQMLAISRALMSRPRLVLFDEPSLGLAPNLVERTFDIIKDIRAQGVTVVMVEQNAFAALELSDRAYVLEQGRVTLSGPGADLLHNPHVKTAYLGA